MPEIKAVFSDLLAAQVSSAAQQDGSAFGAAGESCRKNQGREGLAVHPQVMMGNGGKAVRAASRTPP